MTLEVHSDKALIRRIRLFAAINLAILSIGVGVALVLVVNVSETIAGLAGLVPAMGITLALLLLRNQQALRRLTIAYIIYLIVFFSLLDPLSGTLSGSTWILLLIWPSLALLVLRSLRIFAIAVGLDLFAFLISSMVTLNKLVPIEFLRNEQDLWVMWGIDLLVFSVITIMMTQISRDVRDASSIDQTTLDHYLKAEKELADAYAQAQEVNQRLQQTHERQQLLREQARALQVPLISLSPTLALLPLVGRVDTIRIANLRQQLPPLLHARNIATVVMDITGAVFTENELITDLNQLIDVIILLGCKPILTGISAEIAAMMADADTSGVMHYTQRLERVIATDFAANATGSAVQR